MKKKVIIDGDWGGDEMQLASVLLADNQIEIVGATACYGNAGIDHVFNNGRNIMHLLDADNIPVYRGAGGPMNGAHVEEDVAHGEDGVGGVVLKPSPVPVEKKNAVDFILEQLRSNPEGTVTITASGPLTNIAMAFKKDPKAMMRVKDIIVMGGGVAGIKAADMPVRLGNITKNAEFNFYSAPEDADMVLNSGLPITLLPMNCTRKLTFTPERQEALKESLNFDKDAQEKIFDMMCAPADLDRRKFNSDPTMHDVHCALYFLHPELYSTFKGNVSVIREKGEELGRSKLKPNKDGRLNVAMKIKDANKCFDIFLKSITKVLGNKRLKRMQRLVLKNKIASR
ncbi:MAG: nucleoside hydrolase [Alphaproteobacteria bacterium]